MKKLLLSLLVASSLHAEIDQVTLTWDTKVCEKNCIDLLKRTLDRFPPVAAYKINPAKGIAYLRWHPESQFDLISIKRVYQSVGFGFGIGDVQLKVRGVIEKKGQDYVLRSIGDNTRFRLLGQANPSKTSFASTGSYLSYPLSSDQSRQLQEALSENLIVEVAGGIFYVEYDYPMIMTDKLSFPNKLPEI